MNKALDYEMLRDAVAGEAVALRSRVELEPAGGKDEKVFPPTYGDGGFNKYAKETRLVGDREIETVLLDSVASQANRAEQALRDAWEAEELSFPVPFIDFSSQLSEFTQVREKHTVLDAPHRLADAAFNASLLGGTPFRESDIGRAVIEARPRDATALFRYSPTALLFGQWDSFGSESAESTAKFQRAYVSEIVGLDAKFGTRVSSRIEPLPLVSEAATIYEHKDPAQVWTLDSDKAKEDDKGKPKKAGKVPGKEGRPAGVGLGNITPAVKDEAGGVTISVAIQTTVISLAALRKLRFASQSRETETAARTAIAALGVAALAHLRYADYDLRSRCLLIPRNSPNIELVGRDGNAPETVDISRESAAEVLNQAAGAAAKAGLGWETDEIKLEPGPELLKLLIHNPDNSEPETPKE